MKRQDKIAEIERVWTYRSGKDSCNSVYLGSQEQANSLRILGSRYGSPDVLKALLTNASDDQINHVHLNLFDTIKHMRMFAPLQTATQVLQSQNTLTYKLATQSRLIDDPHSFTPDPNECIHALPNINRWNGHTSAPFSVAQHSLHAVYSAYKHENITDPALLLKVLTHDFAEAYIGDIIKPIKNLCSIADLELKILGDLHDQMNLPADTDESRKLVKKVDLRCVVTEYRDLFVNDDCPLSAEPYPEDLRKLASYIPVYIRGLLQFAYNSLLVLTSGEHCNEKMLATVMAEVANLVGATNPTHGWMNGDMVDVIAEEMKGDKS